MKAQLKLMVLAVAAGAAPVLAQTDSLYMVDGFGSGIMYVSQGGTITNSWRLFTGSGNESPVAVGSTVRTMGYSSGLGGAEYTLGGTFTGNTYTNSTGYSQTYDGTTDGSRNYTVDYSTGDVLAGNTDWT